MGFALRFARLRDIRWFNQEYHKCHCERDFQIHSPGLTSQLSFSTATEINTQGNMAEPQETPNVPLDAEVRISRSSTSIDHVILTLLFLCRLMSMTATQPLTR